MTTREELFRETEEKIEKTTLELRSRFFDLGIMLFRNPDLLPGGMGVTLVKAAESAEAQLKEAENRKTDDESFMSLYEQKRREKIEKDDRLEVLRESEREIRLKLGALIYEQCSLELLPRESFSSVYADTDEEKSLSEKSRSRSFWSRLCSSSALRGLKRSDKERYLDYSSFADNDATALMISGEKAQNLIKELDEVKSERALLTNEEERLEEYLSENLSRRKTLDKGGLEEDSTSLEEMKAEFDECIINYGNYLYDRGGSWIGENTPSEVLDVLQLILEDQNEYGRLQKRREQLQKEAKADDYKALIEEERNKIRILEEEKSRIDVQIDEIAKEIERLEGLVERLVRTQEQK